MSHALIKKDNTPVPEKKQPWHQLEDEPDFAYHAFLFYLSLPIAERSISAAYRNYLVENKLMLPGDPMGSHWAEGSVWRNHSMKYDWVKRVKAYDVNRNTEMMTRIETAGKEAIQEMVARQIDVAQLMVQVAVRNFFEFDDDGFIKKDMDGSPILKKGMDNDAAAVRAIREGFNMERIARGQPSEIATQTTEQIRRRIVELTAKMQIDTPLLDDEDTIDGEFTEEEI